MKIKTLLISLCCLATILSCKKQFDEEIQNPIQLTTATSVSNPKNPYSVINMRKTVANLLISDIQLINNNQSKFAKGKVMFAESNLGLSINKKLSNEQSSAIASKNINATHYYIKFIPRNEADYNKLKLDSNLLIYPFPLDNEVTQYKGNYRDPAVAKGVPTYQYAAIAVDYKLPDVPYQKLEDLFLPDVSNDKSSITLRGDEGSSYSINSITLANRAECEGNEGPGGPDVGEHEEEMPVEEDCDEGSGYPPGGPYSNGDEWKPNGRITMFDDSHNQTIGIEGIKVRARRWFTTYTDITDANGYYAVDGWFTRPANYWLNFERYEFSVNGQEHGYPEGSREISGPKQEAPWNYNLDGYDKYCGDIFRAAFHYYYKDIQGLQRPPQNGFWQTQVKLMANPTGGGGNTLPTRSFWGAGELIHIETFNYSSMQTYATTIHELGHAVHLQIGIPPSWAENIVCESWSRGVEYVLTRMEYLTYPGGTNNVPEGYTNIILDLIDDGSNPINTRGKFGTEDMVSGYTIVQIQDALIGAPNWNSWKNNLKNNYENSTEQHLDALFAAWAN